MRGGIVTLDWKGGGVSLFETFASVIALGIQSGLSSGASSRQPFLVDVELMRSLLTEAEALQLASVSVPAGSSRRGPSTPLVGAYAR